MQLRYNDYKNEFIKIHQQEERNIKLIKDDYNSRKKALEKKYSDQLNNIIYEILYKSLSSAYFEQMYIGFKVVKHSSYFGGAMTITIEEKRVSTAMKKGAKRLNYERIKKQFFSDLKIKTVGEVNKLSIDAVWKEKCKKGFINVIDEIRKTFIQKYESVFQSLAGGKKNRPRRQKTQKRQKMPKNTKIARKSESKMKRKTKKELAS
jgi:hypothetical protein